MDRYRGGEREAVWDEIRAMEREAAEASDEVRAIATATMERAARNITTIISRLHDLGYRWGAPATENRDRRNRLAMWESDPELARRFKIAREAPDLDEYRYNWIPPADSIISTIDAVADVVPGGLPLALRALYRHVGRVDLSGSLPSWDPATFMFEGPEPWPEFGVVSAPLVLYDPDITLGYVPHGESRIAPVYMADDGSYSVYLGADATHGAGYSGGCHTVVLPQATVDPTVSGVEDRSDLTLVEFLRWTFDWGGFPGFESSPSAPPELDILRADLLPL